jgi:hypothetical protein
VKYWTKMIETHFQRHFRIRRAELLDRDCHGAGQSRIEDLPSRHIEPVSLERYLSFPRLVILRSCSIVRETVNLTLRQVVYRSASTKEAA